MSSKKTSKTTTKPKKEETVVEKKVIKKKESEFLILLNKYKLVLVFVIGVFIGIGVLLISGYQREVVLKNGKTVIASTEYEKITIDDLYDKLKESYARDMLINMLDITMLDKKYPADDEMNTQIENELNYYKEYYQDNFSEFIRSVGATTENEFKKLLKINYQKTKAVNDYIEKLLTDKEINAYYEDEIVGDIKASHILIKSEATDDMSDTEKATKEEEALNKAKDLIKQLNDGADFATLAKQYSADGSASAGGDLGFFNKGAMDAAFEAAAYSLKDNEYTKEPVKSAFGYHIILKTETKEKDKLDAVKSDIVEALIKEKLESDASLNYKALDQLRKDTKLKINDKVLQQQYDDYLKYQIENANNTTA